jgi:predicted ester cyclase
MRWVIILVSATLVMLLLAGGAVLAAPLLALLGVMFLREARERAYGKAERLEAEENRKKARRLYEDVLGHGDLSVVDELVSINFRDLRSGSRGKLGMERVLQGLWRSFPDLVVSVEDQEAEGDLVRTHLVLSGTDRGGVLWYPPTNRHAAFSVEFVDRFWGGELVEHGGSADTEGLLRQLGHPGEDRSAGQ